MKKLLFVQIAALALMVATFISNTACVFIAYQEPLPESVKQLRKF